MIILVLAAALPLAALVLIESADEPEGAPRARFAGAQLPPGVRAPDFALRDQNGRLVETRRLRGRPVVVTFLYTHCKESCPAQVQQIRGALDQLGRDLPALAISVDPPRDTPAAARAFLAKQHSLGRVRFVLGRVRDLRPVWRGYAIRPQQRSVEHQARIVLVDRRGFQRIGFPGEQATPERLAHDLRLLLAE